MMKILELLGLEEGYVLFEAFHKAGWILYPALALIFIFAIWEISQEKKMKKKRKQRVTQRRRELIKHERSSRGY